MPKDTGVQITPPFYAYSAHRGMQRALVDMKAPEGRERSCAWSSSADVLIESFRPGVVDRLGIGWDDASARNPRLVYCSTSGFGQTGPRSQWAGHDLNYLGGRRVPALHRARCRRATRRYRASRWPTAPAAACTR